MAMHVLRKLADCWTGVGAVGEREAGRDCGRRAPAAAMVRGGVLLSALLATACLMPGCSLSQPAPVRELYGIPVPVPPPSGRGSATGVPAAGLPADQVLRVETVRLVSPFDERNLIYLVGSDVYESDYYRAFVAAPSALLTTETVRVLEALRPAPAVIGPASSADASRRVEITVTRFVGDYRDPQRPRGAVAARFVLLRETPSATLVEGEWNLEDDVPLATPDPSSLPAALGEAYGRILRRWVNELS